MLACLPASLFSKIQTHTSRKGRREDAVGREESGREGGSEEVLSLFSLDEISAGYIEGT